jgi:hypothetical protein
MAVNRYYSAIAQDTTITSGISSSSTSVVVAATTGFPSSYPFALALDYGNALEEIVDVTYVSGLTLTITRGVNSTTAVAHATGATVRHVITARDLTDAQTHYNTALSAGAHGVTGALATFLGSTTSANLAAVVTDETGSGALVFGTSPALTTPKIQIGFNAQTGTTYTLVAADQDKLVTLSNANPITLTIPSGIFSAGAVINIQQIGAGQVTVANDGTSTFTGVGTKLRAQYSAASIVCTASNTFTLIGDIA